MTNTLSAVLSPTALSRVLRRLELRQDKRKAPPEPNCSYCGVSPAIKTTHYHGIRSRIKGAGNTLDSFRTEATSLLGHTSSIQDARFTRSLEQIINRINAVRAQDTPRRQKRIGAQFWRALQRKLSTRDHVYPQTLYFPQLRALPSWWGLIPVCSHCNHKKGHRPFLAHVHGVPGFLSEPFVTTNGDTRRSFEAFGPPRRIERQRIVNSVGEYFRNAFARTWDIPFNSPKESRNQTNHLLTVLGLMSLTGSRRETFPPPERKIDKLLGVLSESDAFSELLADPYFHIVIAAPDIDHRLKPIANTLLGRRPKRLFRANA
jgi:hypothetical protein